MDEISRKPTRTVTELASARQHQGEMADHHGARGGGYVDEHTDVDDGRRLGVSGVERGWPCTSYITPRGRVGGRKTQKAVRCRVSKKRGERFLTTLATSSFCRFK